MMPPPPRSTLFPYTTLFRSVDSSGVLSFAVEHSQQPISTFTVGFDGAQLDERPYARLARSEEHTSELQSPVHLVCRLLLEKKKKKHDNIIRQQIPTTPTSCN